MYVFTFLIQLKSFPVKDSKVFHFTNARKTGSFFLRETHL